MPAHTTVTVRLDDETRDALQAAAELAAVVRELLEFVPAGVSPVVLTLDRLAPLQAALDSFTAAALRQEHPLVELRSEPDPPARDVEAPAEPPARELEPDPPARDVEAPAERPARPPRGLPGIPVGLGDAEDLEPSERIERANARKLYEAAHRAASAPVVIGSERRAAERLEELGVVTYSRADRRVEVSA